MTYSYTRHYESKNQNNSAYNVAAELFPYQDCENAQSTIKRWPGYYPTPLVKLSDIAQNANVKNIFYKDESCRFGLGSFKALGGAYAIQRLVEQQNANDSPTNGLVVCTATDGNHGVSVSWGAKQAGIECHIFLHAHVSINREKTIKKYGAIVHRIQGNYDDSVAACTKMAEANDWQIISDTSWEGYKEVPRQIMAGYSVMTQEIIDQLNGNKPSHIILQAGCGGMAGSVLATFWDNWKNDLPTIVIVESEMSDCVYSSLIDDKIKLVNISDETIMAGLSCGEVSQLAWPILRLAVKHVVTIDDSGVIPMMRWLGNPTNSERPALVAGECSASGLIALMAIRQDSHLSREIGINESSQILVLGTEGATDPDFYKMAIR